LTIRATIYLRYVDDWPVEASVGYAILRILSRRKLLFTM